jgi:hypothetical protein
MKVKKKKMGAKPILASNKEAIKVFLEGIQLGQTIKDSAEFANISPSSIYLWVEKGEADKEAGKKTIYSDFLESFYRAKQQFIRNGLYQIYQASKQDWRAAAYLLKMRHPDTYGDRQDGRLTAEEMGVKIINDVK